MRILVFGKNGQLASCLRQSLKNHDVQFSGNEEFDLNNVGQLMTVLTTAKPQAVVNASAYTAVDKAEDEEDLAYRLNAKAPDMMAKYCAERDLPFLHFSTDYVFDGAKESPYLETDKCAPLNVYGRSKLKGEQQILAHNGRSFIFRTSWVYSAFGNNFVKTMLRLGQVRESLSIVSDQVGGPTYARDLAQAVARLLEQDLNKSKSGIYHLTGTGQCSWYEFAQEIFAIARTQGVNLKLQDLLPISTEEFPTPAQRPRNSRLDCSKANQQLNIQLPFWKESLKICMEELNGSH